MNLDGEARFKSASELGHAVLDEAAGDVLKARIARAEAAGGKWIFDPEVDGVVGFVADPDGSLRKVQVVVYLADDDFECDDVWAES